MTPKRLHLLTGLSRQTINRHKLSEMAMPELAQWMCDSAADYRQRAAVLLELAENCEALAEELTKVTLTGGSGKV